MTGWSHCLWTCGEQLIWLECVVEPNCSPHGQEAQEKKVSCPTVTAWGTSHLCQTVGQGFAMWLLGTLQIQTAVSICVSLSQVQAQTPRLLHTSPSLSE
jgi:hypothetical protein